MEAKKLKKITEKLKNEGDITLEEADEIYRLFSTETARHEFNPHSNHYDPELLAEFIDYVKTANGLLNDGHTGNFVCSFPLFARDCESKKAYDPIRPMLNNIRLNLPVTDRAKSAVLSKDLYRLAKDKRYIVAYKSEKEVFDSSRAGLFRINGLHPLLNNFVPVPSMNNFFIACYKAFSYGASKPERIIPEWFSGLLTVEAVNSVKVPFAAFSFETYFIALNDVFLVPKDEAKRIEKAVSHIKDINKILTDKKIIVPEFYAGKNVFRIDDWQKAIETGKELFVRIYRQDEKSPTEAER